VLSVTGFTPTRLRLRDVCTALFATSIPKSFEDMTSKEKASMPLTSRRLALAAALTFAFGAAVAQTASPAPLDFKTATINPEDLLDTNKTLLVPTAYVTLVTEGRVAAAKQSGFFQSGNASAKAAASYKVAGLDKAFAQQLAQAVLDDLVTQLRAAGYTVLTYADVKDRDVVKAAQRETSAGPMGLPTKTEGGNTLVTAAPSDEQHFKSSFAGGEFAEFMGGGKSRFADATLILPQYTFFAPQAWAEGSRGYKSVSAEVNVAAGMTLVSAGAYWMGQPKSRMMRGAPGVATRQFVIVSEKTGELSKTADTTPQTANAVSSLLSTLTGAGNIQSSSSEYLLSIDRDAYRAGVLNGARGFNAEVAKAAAAAAKP
jgi:hypothetical protein